MIRATTYLFIFLGCAIYANLGLSVTKFGDRSEHASGRLIEVDPLKTMVGDPSLRIEVPVFERISVELFGENETSEGDRDDMLDSKKTFGLGAMYYPQGFLSESFFFGAALGYESIKLGRQREADTQTWVGTTSEDRYDRWRNHDDYITFRQTVGARLFMRGFTTASIRLVLDQPIWENHSVREDQINSSKIHPGSPGRDQFGKHFMLHAGFQLP
jgi:hypothetical protein